MHIDVPRLNAELALRGLTRLDLARKLKTPPTTLSGWLRDAHPGPADLADRIETALELPEGTLQSERVG